MTDTPTIDGDDNLEVESIDHPFSFDDDPENVIHRRILTAINLMGAGGPNAEDRYQSALDQLFRESDEVLKVIREEYDYLSEDQYLDRWALVQLTVELADPQALDFLDEILSSEIPSERSEEPHLTTTVGEEVMIRTTAVEALTRIAARDNEEALDLLRKHAHHDDFSVKRACVQGYLEHSGDDARRELLQELPERDHNLLDIKQVDVREVPQADPQNFLKTEINETPPADPSDEREERDEE